MDMYGLGLSGIPMEYRGDFMRAQQQQAIAQAMLAQSQDQQPVNQMAGGFVVPTNPLQGLSKIAQAYIGAKMMQQGNDSLAGIGQKYQAEQTDAIDKVRSALAPRTLPLPDSSAAPPETMSVEKPLADKRAVLEDALLSKYPTVSSFATNRLAEMRADTAREDTQSHQAQQAQLTREQNMTNLLLQLQDKQTGREQQAALMKEIAQIKQQGGGANPFFQFLPTDQGYAVGNARTGQITPGAVNGQPVMRATDSPVLQGQIAGAKASGKELGEAGAKAKLDLPGAIDKANLASQQIDQLLTHPGFSSAVGATLKPGARFVDGTPEADFTKRLDQVKGGAFLQAFETLKGGGQITEMEGKKATEALSRMDKAQSEKEFTAAAREFQGFIQKGVERAKGKAGVAPSAPATNGGWSIRPIQ